MHSKEQDDNGLLYTILVALLFSLPRYSCCPAVLVAPLFLLPCCSRCLAILVASLFLLPCYSCCPAILVAPLFSLPRYSCRLTVLVVPLPNRYSKLENEKTSRSSITRLQRAWTPNASSFTIIFIIACIRYEIAYSKCNSMRGLFSFLFFVQIFQL